MKSWQQVVLSFVAAFLLCSPVIYSAEVCSFSFMNQTMREEQFDKNNPEFFSTAEFLVNIADEGEEKKQAIHGTILLPLDSLNYCIDEPLEFISGGNRAKNCENPNGPYSDPNNTIAWAYTTIQFTLDVIFIDVLDLPQN